MKLSRSASTTKPTICIYMNLFRVRCNTLDSTRTCGRHIWGEDGRNWCSTRNTSKIIAVSTFTEHRRDCLFSTKCNRTAEFASVYCSSQTIRHGPHSTAEICEVTTSLFMRLIGGETHPSLAVVEYGFISVNEWSVRFHEKSLYDVELCARCAMSVTRMIGPFFFPPRTMLSHRFCKTHTHILTLGLWTLLELTLRWLMSYIYGAPILDVSRSHTTTQHSR